MYRYNRIKDHYKFIFLIILTLSICFVPYPSIAQVANSRVPNKAPVVLDGQVLFEVGNFGIFSAEERARTINQVLIDTVKSSDQILIEVVELENQITIRDISSERHLLTITQEDIISAATPYGQAIIWKERLTTALQTAQKERTYIYQSKALLTTIVVVLLTVTLYLILRFFRRFISRKINNLFSSQVRFKSWNKLLIRWKNLTILGLQFII